MALKGYVLCLLLGSSLIPLADHLCNIEINQSSHRTCNPCNLWLKITSETSVGDKIFVRISDKLFVRISEIPFVRIGDKLLVRIGVIFVIRHSLIIFCHFWHLIPPRNARNIRSWRNKRGFIQFLTFVTDNVSVFFSTFAPSNLIKTDTLCVLSLGENWKSLS